MNRLKIYTILILFLLILILFFSFNKNKNIDFEIYFLDVGQGNSTFIKYKGLNFLIDSGKDLYARKTFYNNISFFDKDIDFIFASHYDFDHVGNFLDYFKKYNILYFLRNGKESKAPIYKELLNLTERKNIKNIDLVSGDILKIDNNLFIKVLFPEENINKNSLRDNTSSLILQIFYKEKVFLITGDAPKKIEKWLVKKYGNKLKSDILLAGHHGSKTSSSEEFLKTVNPDLIIFSVGRNNSYHHPNKEVIGLVNKLNIKYLRTDEVGTIIYKNNKNNWELILEKK